MNEIKKRICCTKKIFSCIGKEWTIQILINIENQKNTFGQLRRKIGAVTPRVLTEHLKQLQQIGFVERVEIVNETRNNSFLPKVEYSLSEKGKKILQFIKGEELLHIDAIHQANNCEQCDFQNNLSKFTSIPPP